MLKGFNSLSDLQVYWDICEKTYLRSSHGQQYQDLIEPLAKLYSYVIEYQACVICHLSRAQLSRAWRDVKGWNDWDGKAAKINDLSNWCTSFIPHLEAEEIRRNRDIQLRKIQESQTILDEIRRTLEEGGKQTQRIYEDQKESDLLKNLASNYEGYKNFNPEKVPGTCEWFFDDERFRSWRDSSSSLLWVSAGPGCGKSVLSRALVDEHRLATNITTSTVCYFFFKDGDERRTDSTNALCAILHQIFTQDTTGSLIEHALDSHRNLAKELTQNFSELWRILETCARASDTEIVCILDALDECNWDGRRQLINQLKLFYSKDQASSRPSNLKFLITSRPYDDLEASFRKLSNTSAYMRFDGDDKSEQIGREINLVIDARMRDIADDLDLDDEDRRTISERLKSMKNRTYLWLHLTFDIIEHSPSAYSRRSDIERLLSDLPSKVSEAYEKILSRSNSSLQTNMLLQIVLAAAQPLTLGEANVALTLALERQWQTSYQAFEKKKWSPDSFKGVVKNLCGLLINVYDSKLSLIHQTAREFLTAKLDSQMKWKGRFNMRQSHSTMSLTCLRYLVLSDNVEVEQNNFINYQQYPFLLYAAANWPFHYIESLGILRDLEECHKFLWNLSEATEKAPQSEESQRFKDNQIKVAIIGDGVAVSESNPYINNFVDGVSFVTHDPDSDSNLVLPWWHAEQPHGTQISSLINKVNPFCHFYIAKVGNGRKDILPQHAVKVWTIKLVCTFLAQIVLFAALPHFYSSF